MADESPSSAVSTTIATRADPPPPDRSACKPPTVEVLPTWERVPDGDEKSIYLGPGTLYELTELTVRIHNRSSEKIWISYLGYRFEWIKDGKVESRPWSGGVIPDRPITGTREFDSVMPGDSSAFTEKWLHSDARPKFAHTDGAPPTMRVVLENGEDWWFDSPERRAQCGKIAPLTFAPTTKRRTSALSQPTTPGVKRTTVEVPGVGPVEVDIPTS